MSEFLGILIPLEAAMLSPIWLPLLGVGIGKLTDQVRGEVLTPVEGAVREAKARSAAQRLEIRNRLSGHRSDSPASREVHASVRPDDVAA